MLKCYLKTEDTVLIIIINTKIKIRKLIKFCNLITKYKLFTSRYSELYNLFLKKRLILAKSYEFKRCWYTFKIMN